MALDRAQPTTPLYRSTTGQALAVRYDSASNTLHIVEDDWAADGVHGGVLPRNVVHQRLMPGNVTKLRARRRSA
jgi:hypothetical protein